MEIRPSGAKFDGQTYGYANAKVQAQEFNDVSSSICSASCEKRTFTDRAKECMWMPIRLVTAIVKNIICVLTLGYFCSKPDLKATVVELEKAHKVWADAASTEDQKKAAFATLKKNVAGIEENLAEKYVQQMRLRHFTSNPKALNDPARQADWDKENKETYVKQAKTKLEAFEAEVLHDLIQVFVAEISEKAGK